MRTVIEIEPEAEIYLSLWCTQHKCEITGGWRRKGQPEILNIDDETYSSPFSHKWRLSLSGVECPHNESLDDIDAPDCSVSWHLLIDQKRARQHGAS